MNLEHCETTLWSETWTITSLLAPLLLLLHNKHFSHTCTCHFHYFFGTFNCWLAASLFTPSHSDTAFNYKTRFHTTDTMTFFDGNVVWMLLWFTSLHLRLIGSDVGPSDSSYIVSKTALESIRLIRRVLLLDTVTRNPFRRNDLQKLITATTMTTTAPLPFAALTIRSSPTP